MFDEITNFSYKRTRKQAFGFYIFYILIDIIIAVITYFFERFILGFSNSKIHSSADLVGKISTSLYSAFVLILVLKGKNFYKSFKYKFLVFLTFIMTLSLGTFFGLIPASYLSTFDKRN